MFRESDNILMECAHWTAHLEYYKSEDDFIKVGLKMIPNPYKSSNKKYFK